MLGELLIFAVVLVALQMVMSVLVTLLLMKVFTSKKFIIKFTKRYMDLIEEVTEELVDSEENES